MEILTGVSNFSASKIIFQKISDVITAPKTSVRYLPQPRCLNSTQAIILNLILF